MIRHLALSLVGSCFLLLVSYTSNRGFDPSAVSDKVELEAGDKLFEYVCVTAFILLWGDGGGGGGVGWFKTNRDFVIDSVA